MSKQQIRREELEMEIGDKVYKGYRIITGKRKMTQKIFFQDKSALDNYIYESWKIKDLEGYMETRAKDFLKELVKKHFKDL